MRAVDELLQPLLGDQQHLVEQEEGSLLLHSVDLEGTFQNQLSKPAQVRPAPVHQQGLDFLWGGGGGGGGGGGEGSGVGPDLCHKISWTQ